MNIFDNKDECFILRSGVFLEYKMGFEKLEDLLPYSVNRIEEKMVMKPKEAIELSEHEQELSNCRKQKKLKQTGME